MSADVLVVVLLTLAHPPPSWSHRPCDWDIFWDLRAPGSMGLISHRPSVMCYVSIII